MTTTVSASSRATCPISGRFSRSRSPPAPNTTTRRPDPERTGGAEDRRERVGGVRVVDDDGEVLSLVDRLESAGNAGHGADALDDRVLVDVEEERGRDRAENVLDVEDAEQRRLDRDARRREGRAARAELEAVGPHLRLRPQPEGDERRTMGACELVREPPAVRVADVHRRRRGHDAREQAALRLEVLLHVAVEVEMVLRQVREHERVEPHPVEPTVVRAVGRGFERDGLVARVEHLAKDPLEVDRLGCRVRGGAGRAADDPLDRSDQPRSTSARFEDRAEHVGRRRLAVRPRDARDGEPFRRRAEEHVCRDGHRRPRRLDDELRDGDVDRALDDERGRPRGGGVGGEIVAVDARARDAEEQRAVTHPARCVGEVGDLDGTPPDHVARCERADQRVELHGAIVGARLAWAAAEAHVLRDRGEPRAYGVENAAATSDDERFDSGASGGTSRYWSANRARSRKIGAATTPPQICPCGSSTITRIASRGLRAGTRPTKEATYFWT